MTFAALVRRSCSLSVFDLMDDNSNLALSREECFHFKFVHLCLRTGLCVTPRSLLASQLSRSPANSSQEVATGCWWANLDGMARCWWGCNHGVVSRLGYNLWRLAVKAAYPCSDERAAWVQSLQSLTHEECLLSVDEMKRSSPFCGT